MNEQKEGKMKRKKKSGQTTIMRTTVCCGKSPTRTQIMNNTL